MYNIIRLLKGSDTIMPIVTFVRHGESRYNKKGLFCGRIYCCLTKQGMQSAQKSEISKLDFDYFYCSPQQRTKQTLQAMFPNIIPIEDERLSTLYLGDWEGKRKSLMDQTLVNLYRSGKYTPPNGETFEEIDKRTYNFVCDIFDTYPKNKKILVVTSNGIIRSIKRTFLGDNINVYTDNLEYITLTNKEYLEGKNKYDN